MSSIYYEVKIACLGLLFRCFAIDRTIQLKNFNYMNTVWHNYKTSIIFTVIKTPFPCDKMIQVNHLIVIWSKFRHTGW